MAEAKSKYMTKLRAGECHDAKGDALPDDTALFLIQNSVAKRRELIFGHLRDGYGGYCAIGAFWEDNPKAILNSSLIDEVAAVNDSVPPSSTPKERWKKVNSWLRFKIAILAGRKPRAA
jgi:hypothetical protein